MVPPLPLGSLLRQRYLVQAILGQGGFGRTYLATDQERFDERCVLKEFFVPYQDEALTNKSQSLFQREASTLYQIQHPQVPRFSAAFEEERRLFLVQGFVDGHTYRHLLQERRQQGQTFCEAEVLHLLSQTLPVLTYLHDRGIIHRDLSPDNIMLKPILPPGLAGHAQVTTTGLPVIIDFGAVKEATTHWATASTITRVGKVGYAPPEQLQTGQVYSNSDLYSLAASCMVLLTGQEPRSLLNSQTLEWQWQPHAQISDSLAHVLTRMLSVYPSDRYSSAKAVYDDLQALFAFTPEPPEASNFPLEPIYPAALFTTVLHADQPTQPHPNRRVFQPSRRQAALRPPEKRTALHPRTSRRLRWSMAIAFLLGASLGGTWLWQRWVAATAQNGEVWVSGAKLPHAEASRIMNSPGMLSGNSIQPLAEVASVETNSTTPQTIEFSAGKISTTLEGQLQGNTPQTYRLNAAKGQILTTSLHGPGVVMNVLRSNQEGIDTAAYQTRSWTGQLPSDDQYLIQVSGSGGYTLDVAITPNSRPTQDRLDRISFAPGTNGTTVTGNLTPEQIQRYLLKAQRGQLVVVKVIQGHVNFSTIAPDGQRLGGTTGNTKEWKGQLPTEGDYVVEVSAAQPEEFALTIEIF